MTATNQTSTPKVGATLRSPLRRTSPWAAWRTVSSVWRSQSKLLAVESAALKEANDKLLAAEQQQRETERKFDQLRSSTSGRMAFSCGKT